jgi:hypothetical protein
MDLRAPAQRIRNPLTAGYLDIDGAGGGQGGDGEEPPTDICDDNIDNDGDGRVDNECASGDVKWRVLMAHPSMLLL